MKKIVLLIVAIAFGNTMFAQDLSNCKKTCTQDKLVETGAFLGVRIITAENNTHAKVLEVLSNTAAERNHFAINDVITKIDGIVVQGNKHIIEIIGGHQPNDVVKIQYVHNNKTMKKRVVLGALHSKIVTETICCDEIYPTTEKATTSLLPADVKYTLYPNPAVNNLEIKSDLVLTGTVEVSILDMLGNQVLSNKVNQREAALNQKINIKSLATGSYIVKIINHDVVSVFKLAVSK